MWGFDPKTATLALLGQFRARSNALPRLETANFPLPVLYPASLALQPSFTAIDHKACEKVPTGQSVLGVGLRNRRNHPACTRSWILPAGTSPLLSAGQNLHRRRARVSQVDVGRHFGRRLLRVRDRCGRSGDRRRRRIPVVSEQRAQLIGEAAAFA
jgi:hypothetical protein